MVKGHTGSGDYAVSVKRGTDRSTERGSRVAEFPAPSAQEHPAEGDEAAQAPATGPKSDSRGLRDCSVFFFFFFLQRLNNVCSRWGYS